jgi:hypothetical protein
MTWDADKGDDARRQKSHCSYVVEFTLAFSIPRTEAHVIRRHFQEDGLFVPEVARGTPP